MSTRSFPLEPTPIRVSDEVLDDLRRRLTATKWPLDAAVQPPVEKLVPQRPGRVTPRPRRTAGDIEHPAALGAAAPAFDQGLRHPGQDKCLEARLEPGADQGTGCPRTSAVATPRPSAIPPAASTGVGAARSATTGINGRVARRPPWPPASLPWATITPAPTSRARCASSRSVTCTRLPTEAAGLPV
jgi:hypothetical protein